ncbi:MAG: 23S rRNA (pseudouridine(1915)-N(3))-methyltransferase RlmH [Rubrivivax sp.]|nr:23S rRNA (pseudouridine(1915)-N(3))-methyltransferase RlmH [Rubrivivax sp.]
MRVTVLAVGLRQPAWADAAWADFAKRLPPEWRFTLKALKAEPRSDRTAAQCLAAEASRFDAALPRGARRVVLDERGDRVGTAALADRLLAWQADGRDVALLIGGPDGLAPAIKAQADEALRLSDLTLPHAFARVLLVEALYRAWSVTTGHPYHRE